MTPERIAELRAGRLDGLTEAALFELLDEVERLQREPRGLDKEHRLSCGHVMTWRRTACPTCFDEVKADLRTAEAAAAAMRIALGHMDRILSQANVSRHARETFGDEPVLSALRAASDALAPDAGREWMKRTVAAESRLAELEEERTVRGTAWLKGAPHDAPEHCPAYYDCCHCTVETLAHNSDRADKAEARGDELATRVAHLEQAVVHLNADHATTCAVLKGGRCDCAWDDAPIGRLEEVRDAAVAYLEEGLPEAAQDMRRQVLLEAIGAAARKEPLICTCGSGGHPRDCRMHPDRKALHVAEINLENALEHVRDLAHAALTYLEAEVEGLPAGAVEAKRQALVDEIKAAPAHAGKEAPGKPTPAELAAASKYLDMTVREVLDIMAGMKAGKFAFNGPGPKGDKREPFCCAFATGTEDAKALSRKVLETTRGIPGACKAGGR